mmetsp:Transcript_2177/g.5525  ORF Transcript_2177/g.5525 Transcript_2177/m.5525 type:complete len:870 (-) Transcript_2177:299-2908(-)|eukprot:CAMPEP_0202864180 /NCGR_PEP_ID=MMETSP1391-20130828/4525_1 /ASSEMBLY_ACC=CAM_ASM_000867 /TAXON_ID=1034604 /ORGANISM="Chlamydomonas leiostraca, Strain SAG 11-49" /LENGTH=869 /DNA_ID=CAMNT_0049543897 /DNA_START=80 /DNA_END=2689 /DNA_ORIENTATION=+
MEAQTNYSLRAELRGHEEDVRGVMSCELGIVTASRDKTVKLWVEDSPTSLHCLTTFVGHTDYVGALAFIPVGGSPDLTSPAIISGSRDTKVIVWDAVTASPIHTLLGHGYQVTAVGVLPSGEVVSTSLDKSVKVWKGAKCVRTLEGHAGPVLSLAVLPTGGFVTGSGDMTIKQWSGGTCVHTYTGHTDTVRGLCALGDIGFVSASHDMTLKVWALSGEVVAELVGHTAIVYACAAVSVGGAQLIASGSEDNTARLWDPSGACLQVIEHVGCIWDVAFTADGDLVTGCSDAVARLWSAREDRKAPADVAEGYARALQTVKEERAAAKAQEGAGGGGAAGGAGGGGGGGMGGLPPGIKVEEPSALMAPGAKDGAYKFIREATGAVTAYAWDAKTWQWDKVGEVVSEAEAQGAAPGGVGAIKKLHKGREYDFVFDVDVEEGAPPRKLALNRGDNPYIVAGQFCEDEDLPLHFKDQIVQFIIKNTEGAAGGPSVNDLPITGGFCDPFTGGGSGSSSAPPPPMYRPPPQSLADLPITGGFVDPFTGVPGGSGAGAGGAATVPGGYKAGALVHAPARAYLVFDGAPAPDKLAAKVREFNALVAAQPATSALALTAEEAAGGLDALLRQLPAVPSSSPSAPVFPATGGPHAPLLAKLLQWPPAQLFPGLDVARLVALDAGGGASLVAGAGPLGAAGSGLLPDALRTAAAPDAPAANTQLGLRLAANLFKHAAPRAWASANAGALLDAYAHAASSPHKAVRLSFATALSNVAVALHGAGAAAPEDVKLQALSCGIELLNACPTEAVDTLSRALTAVATLLLVGAPASGSAGEAGLVGVARDLGLADALRRVHDAPEAKRPDGRRMLEAALDVMTLIK